MDSEKAEEPEIKLPTSTGSEKKQDNSRKASTSASWTTLKPLTVWITTGKFFKRWEYLPPEKLVCKTGKADHLTCLLRNLYAKQVVTVRTRHGATGESKIRKGICQGYLLSLCLFKLYAEYICEMLS